jgi:crotonobetainyl-CoA:carnitine CoA-transferase CaiB-like acyl-CoA transferase
MSFKEIDCNLSQKFDEYPEFGVLKGVKVFVSGTAIAGPFAGCLMAEMGAKVLQSEAPTISCGTRGTTAWSQNHRNEYSVTINPNTPAGAKLFRKCLAWADIWIESSKAGTYDRFGFSDETCWKINKKLAIVHVSGYGQFGPYKSKASYDVSGQAMGGYMYMNGASPDAAPLKVNPYLSDYVTAYNTCITALSAYINAQHTGEGDSCDVAQYDTMFRLLDNYPTLWFNRGYPKDGEPVPYRTGNHSDLAACFSFYETKDKKQLFVAINGPGVVAKGYPIIGAGTPGVTPGLPKGIPGFPLSTPMGKHIDELCAKYCSEHTCEELEETFNKAGIPNQRAYEPADIEKDPQYEARENLVEWEDQVFGKMKGIGVTNRFKKNPSKIVASAPTFGEHNREVFKSFGYTDEEIDALYKKGDIVTWSPADTAVNRHLADWGFFWDMDEQCSRIGMENPFKKK